MSHKKRFKCEYDYSFISKKMLIILAHTVKRLLPSLAVSIFFANGRKRARKEKESAWKKINSQAEKKGTKRDPFSTVPKGPVEKKNGLSAPLFILDTRTHTSFHYSTVPGKGKSLAPKGYNMALFCMYCIYTRTTWCIHTILYICGRAIPLNLANSATLTLLQSSFL